MGKRRRIDPTVRKLIVYLAGGFALTLSRNPDRYFRILKAIKNELKSIDVDSFHRSIKKAYRKGFVNYRKNKEDYYDLFLSKSGEKEIVFFEIEEMVIKKPICWDGLWRLVIFDIPESKKKGRDALSSKLKKLSFLSIQKSVLIYPYPCWDEVETLINFFDLHGYVRKMIVKDIDDVFDLKKHFRLR